MVVLVFRNSPLTLEAWGEDDFSSHFFSNGKNSSFLVVHPYPLVGDFTGLWTPTLADGFRPHSPMYIFGGSGVPSRCMD